MEVKIKPKLEELIPFYGLWKYCDRCNEERNKCYDYGTRISEFPKDYIVEMSIYNIFVGSAVVGPSLGLLIGLIEYATK